MQMQMQDSDCSSNSNSDAAAVVKLEQQQQLDCPRCGSNNTKFCYYNNYNTSQPRHFCKGCRRYWTKGGALRNVPIGGGTRKKSSSKRVTKKNIAKPVNMSSVLSAPVITEVDYPVVQHQPVPVPVPVAAYQPMMPTDLNGYFGNFNLSIAGAGFPLAVPPEMQSSTESSGGENEMFALNGDFSYLYGGWQ